MGKRLGIIGGMGTFATVDFFQKIAANTAIESKDGDQDHLDILIDNRASLPGRMNYIAGQSNISPVPVLIAMAQGLVRQGADFLAMPCNTAHYFYEELAGSVSVPFLHIAHETLNQLESTSYTEKSLLLLGTQATLNQGIYDAPAAQRGWIIKKPSLAEQDTILSGILAIKSGKQVDRQRWLEFLQAYPNDLLVLACTELPILFSQCQFEIPNRILDPTLLLARACIAFAGKKLTPMVT